MIKNIRVVDHYPDPKNRCTEYNIYFTLRVYDGQRDRDIVHESCQKVTELLMADPRRSESFPVVQGYGTGIERRL